MNIPAHCQDACVWSTLQGPTRVSCSQTSSYSRKCHWDLWRIIIDRYLANPPCWHPVRNHFPSARLTNPENEPETAEPLNSASPSYRTGDHSCSSASHCHVHRSLPGEWPEFLPLSSPHCHPQPAIPSYSVIRHGFRLAFAAWDTERGEHWKRLSGLNPGKPTYSVDRLSTYLPKSDIECGAQKDVKSLSLVPPIIFDLVLGFIGSLIHGW